MYILFDKSYTRISYISINLSVNTVYRNGVRLYSHTIITSFKKKDRDDFRSDFDKSYGSYYTDQSNFNLNFTDPQDKNQLKQIEAAVRISFNLYLHTFSTSPDVLNVKYADSRFRCMIFCLSTMLKSCEDVLTFI